MKKSMNKVKFLTVALVLSVLVSSCNIDDLFNKAKTLFDNFGGMMDDTVATDGQVEEIKGNCTVQVYSSNASGITVSQTIADSDLACSVDRPPSGGHAQASDVQAPDEVWLAIANVKGVKKLAPKFLVSDMVDPGEFGIGDYLVPFDSAGNPLDSEGVVFQNSTPQQPSLIFLQATSSKWCFVKKKDPAKAYVVTFTEGKNVDEISDTGTCDAESILAIAAAGDPTGGDPTGGTGSFVPNCSWVSLEGNIPVRCVVNGNILNVTMLVPMQDETLVVSKLGDFDSDAKSVTTYGTDENGNETVTTMVSGQTRETDAGTVTLTYVFTVTAKNWKIEVQEGDGAIQPMFEFVLN